MEHLRPICAYDAARHAVPDAIVLDLMLPLIDGYGVLEALTEDTRVRDIPVIVPTAKAPREDRVRCWASGASDFMTKPFSPAALTESLDLLLAMSVDER